MTQKTLFLDTMVYLHYKPLDQIERPSVVDADRVSIVAPRAESRGALLYGDNWVLLDVLLDGVQEIELRRVC